MSISTVTTEAIAGVADLKAGYTLGHADVAILKTISAELLAVREAQPVAHIFKHPNGRLFWQLIDDSQAGHKDVIPVYAAPPAPAVPADYQHLKHVSESYFAVEKRLFDLAQRLKGPSFDHYAYSLHQAIDVLDKEIFGEGEDNNAALAAAPTPTK